MAKKLFATGAVSLLVVLAALSFVDFDTPRLGQVVMERASRATGARLSATGFRLNLLRGLVLEGVQAESELPGGRYRIDLDRLVLEHRWLPLLSGKLAVNRIVLKRPRLELLESAGASLPKSAPEKGAEAPETTGEAAPGGLTVEIQEIALEDGSIRIHSKGKGGKDRRRAGPASVEGLSLRLRDLSFDPKAGSLVHALSANGGLEVENVTFESTHIRKARGQLRLGEGRFEVQELRFATEQGSFLARLLVDFNRLPFGYALTLLGEPLDVNAMVGATGAGGFGPGRLELEAEGFGSDSRNMKGKGVLRMDAGRLPSTPMLVSIEKSLGRTALVGSPYRAMENAFRIRNNRVFLDQFELEAEQVAIDLDGWVSLDGPLNLRLVVRTPRQGLKIKEVDDHVLDALTTDKGWVAIPFKVTGTMEEPRLRPDSRALMAQAGQGTRRLMKKKATEGIKSLFRRKLP